MPTYLRFFLFLFPVFVSLTLKSQVNSQNSKKIISITIDDLPAISLVNSLDQRLLITKGILDGLTRHDCPAIGFVNEMKLYKNGKEQEDELILLDRWVNAGMKLGNHGYSHMDYNTNEFELYSYDIKKGEIITNRVLAKVGEKVKYFRHPYLRKGNTSDKKKKLEEYLRSINYIEAPVTIDNSEWIYARAYERAYDQKDSLMVKRIAASYLDYMVDKTRYFEQQSRELFGYEIGQVLLIHANLLNAENLDGLLTRLEGIGYTFESLDKVLEDKAYQSEDNFVGNGGISWIHRWALTQGKKGDFFKGEPLTPEFVQEVAGIKE